MRPALERLSPLLHLTRTTTAFAAVGNVWFVILWTRATEQERVRAPARLLEMPLWLALLAGALLAISLFAYAMALNDTLDVRRDRALHPDRPLPAGRLRVEAAVGMVAVTLVCSIVGAAMIDIAAVWMCVLTAMAILGYHAVARFFPSVGLVVLGLIYGGHMLIPNYKLTFLWPVWVVMTHALAVGAITHRLAQRRPALGPRVIAWALVGWITWSGALLWVGLRRGGSLWPSWIEPLTAVIPVGLAVAFVFVARRKVKRSQDGVRAAEKVQRYGALWLTLYGAGWLLGQGHLTEAVIIASLAAAGLLGMTIVREVFTLIENPVRYRR